MTLAESLWLIGGLVTVLGVFIGVVWSLLLGKIEALEAAHQELDRKHDLTHERVVQAEVHVATNKEKVDEVDSRRHRYQVENTHSLQDLQKWITEKVIEALKP